MVESLFQRLLRVLISGVKMYTILMFGTAQAVLIRGVSIFQGCPYKRDVILEFQVCPYREVSVFESVLISGLSLFRAVLIGGFQCTLNG